MIIIALGGVGVLIYKVIKKSVTPQSGTTSTIDQVRQQEFNDAIKKLSSTDQDMDGISDNEEAKYQTNVASADTDSDGLIDGQEVFVFKTNPLKADTDGDGNTDGYEARRGLNPNGTGKIKLLSGQKKGSTDPAEDALVQLGFSKQQARDALAKVGAEVKDMEERIKLALKSLGK